MLYALVLALLPAQLPLEEKPPFSKEVQTTVLTATVRIVTGAQGGEGSGVVVKTQGPFVYVLTAKHVVDQAKQLEIHLFNETAYPKPAEVVKEVKVIAQSKDTDLALLRCRPAGAAAGTLRICTPQQLPKKQEFAALTAGCSLAQAPTPGFAAVLAARTVRKPDGSTARVWETDGAVAKGRSGGPLVDAQGLLLGVCSGTSGGKSYYCRPEEIHDFLRQHAFRWLYEEDQKP